MNPLLATEGFDLIRTLWPEWDDPPVTKRYGEPGSQEYEYLVNRAVVCNFQVCCKDDLREPLSLWWHCSCALHSLHVSHENGCLATRVSLVVDCERP